MDNQTTEAPKILKESKNKITVEFERTSLKERLKLKYLNVSYIGILLWSFVRYTVPLLLEDHIIVHASA